MELLDIVDEQGIPTGKTIERTLAHEQGILHRTSHVWIMREKKGRIQVLLQKRSEEKDSYPGCYDISSAGHIPAGVDFLPSAIRELEEELGLSVPQEVLVYCGQRRFQFQQIFHGKPFHDNQVSNIYLLWLDKEPEEFLLQKEEVSAVRWFDFQDCMQQVEKNTIPHCIFMEELNMLVKAIREICTAFRGKEHKKWIKKICRN